MFRIGEYVYYASGGVCVVSDVCYAPLSGMAQDRQYYVLRPANGGDGVMYVPVNSETVFLRGLMSRQAAESLLEQMSEIELIREPNAKALREKYVEAMRQHDPVEWVRVIKTVHYRIRKLAEQSGTRRISDTERTYAEDAKRYLYAELAIALESPFEEMKASMRERIETTV